MVGWAGDLLIKSRSWEVKLDKVAVECGWEVIRSLSVVEGGRQWSGNEGT